MAQNIEKPYSLIQETPTRWNSTYFMIQRIIKTNEQVNQVLSKTKKSPTPLTADEICILEETERLLKIFQDATLHVSGSNYQLDSVFS